jgi:hypothetical protein
MYIHLKKAHIMKNIRSLIIIYLSLINISVFADELCLDGSYNDCYHEEMPETFKENEWKWDNESTRSFVLYYKFTSDGVEIRNDSNSIYSYPVEWINSYVKTENSDGLQTTITENTISFVINLSGTYILINSIYNYMYESTTDTTSDIKEEICVYYTNNEQDAISNNFQEYSGLTTCTTYE